MGIARALMNDPQIVLADEPTSALDHRRGEEVVDILAKQAHQRGVSTLLVTHDLGMLHVADRVLELRDGKLAPATVPS